MHTYNITHLHGPGFWHFFKLWTLFAGKTLFCVNLQLHIWAYKNYMWSSPRVHSRASSVQPLHAPTNRKSTMYLNIILQITHRFIQQYHQVSIMRQNLSNLLKNKTEIIVFGGKEEWLKVSAQLPASRPLRSDYWV